MATARITWNLHMHHNSPNILLPWPLKATLSFKLKMVRCHLFRLLMIYINKQYLAGIQILSSIIFLCLTTGHTLQVHHIKRKNQSLSRSPRVHLAKYDTIPSSKPPTSHVKLITDMNIDNRLDLLNSIVFAMSNQLGGLGPKYE